MSGTDTLEHQTGVVTELKRSLVSLGRGVRDFATSWRSFWFRPADPYMLGIIRLLTGWMLVYNLLVWGSDFDAFFGIHSLQSLQTILEFQANAPVYSFWYDVPEAWLHTVHWACVGVAFLFFIGAGTRVTSIAAYAITISYSQRVLVANFGLDQILGLLCLYLAVGPSGACLSVDALVRRWRARRRNEKYQLPRSSTAQIALRLIQIHLCVIYFWAGFAKLKGESWWTGEAFWQVLANMEYQTWDLTWMAWFPWMPYLLAHVTVVWEVSFCVLIWNRRLRPLLLLIGAGMHFGIGAFLGMWTFGLIMTYAYFAFSDPIRYRRWTAMLTPGFLKMEAAQLVAPAPGIFGDWSNVDQEAERLRKNETAEGQSAPLPDFARTLPPANELFGWERPPAILQESVHAEERVAEPAASDSDILLSGGVEPASPTSLLTVFVDVNERELVHRSLARQDIPCVGANSGGAAIAIVDHEAPAAILVSGSRMPSQKLAQLVCELRSRCDAPILAILLPDQFDELQHTNLPARMLRFPLTGRQIREAVTGMMFDSEPASDAVVRQSRTDLYSDHVNSTEPTIS